MRVRTPRRGLQWGRVLLNAERCLRASLSGLYFPLQWGRVLLNAESGLMPASYCHRYRASMGPRSVERGKRHRRGGCVRRDELQWGRVLLNAERSSRHRPCQCRDWASMGPRSVERGKQSAATARTCKGRASMGPRSVERGKVVRKPSIRPKLVLQWGRVLLNAERNARRATTDLSSAASMGPRSVERGKNATILLTPSTTSGFNGAAFC